MTSGLLKAEGKIGREYTTARCGKNGSAPPRLLGYENKRVLPQHPKDSSTCQKKRASSAGKRTAQCILAIPAWAAIARQLSPLVRKRVTSVASTDTAGRPNFTPRLFAAFCPAMTRSLMMLRSSSATAPSTVKTIFPAGVDVSIASVTETKSMPSAENSSSARRRWLVLGANLSNF